MYSTLRCRDSTSSPNLTSSNKNLTSSYIFYKIIRSTYLCSLTKAHEGPNLGPQLHALQDATPEAKIDELHRELLDLLVFIHHQDILLEIFQLYGELASKHSGIDIDGMRLYRYR